MAEYTPYSSAVPYFDGSPEPGIPDLDAQRLQAYALYEKWYWNHPESFKLLVRGDDETPIYLPSAREIVEATGRFLAVDFDYVLDPEVGTPDAQNQMAVAVKALFKRENFYTKFNAQKRWGLVRGDAIWHITADDTKPEGTRISLHDVHPKRYFPIYEGNKPFGERVIGAHLIETIEDPDDETKQVIRRQTYRKTLDAAGLPTGEITSELTLWTVGKWDDRYLKPEELESRGVLKPATPLPPSVTQIPLYHVRNTWDENAYGSSLVRGIETLLGAANQGVSDQDLAVAFNGLGQYWTDAAPPADEAGNATDWEIGPTRVAEVPPGSTFGRVNGVGSIQPSLDHISFLLERGAKGVGVSDAAIGKVDVTVAESGISLALQLAPILAANAERERGMIDVYDQMFYDLRTMWFPAYEGLTLDVELSSVCGDPMPTNREAKIKETMDLFAAKLITSEEARTKLAELGWEIDPKSAKLLEEAKANAMAADPFGQRVDEELNSGSGTGSPEGASVGAPPEA